VRHRDGSEFSVFLSVGRIPNSEPPQFVGFLHDTSLRRKALATLEHERQLNRLYLDLAQVMLVATNRAGGPARQPARHPRARSVSERDHRLQLGRCCVRRRIGPLARAVYRALLISGTDDPHSCEYHVRSAEGEDRFITWRCVALRDGDGMATGMLLSAKTSPISAAPKARRTRRSNA
jgi:hypothetical protein